MMQNKSLLRLSLIVGAGVITGLVLQNYMLNKNVSLLGLEILQMREESASSTKIFKGIINSTQEELAQTKSERDDFEQKYYSQFDQVNQLSAQVENIQGTVGDLQKLSQIDPELLKKYSKVYFLNENYIPESLAKIDPKYTCDPKSDYFFYSKTWPFLLDLLTTAENANIDIKINSAYRSFATQVNLKSYYTMIYGSGANQFSADQGYSEHQLGTAVDFSTSALCGDNADFDETPTYQWLVDNAYKYGFIISYPKENRYYVYEPWHWRFVGRVLADKLHQEGENFYEMDQREIDKYLINFFD